MRTRLLTFRGQAITEFALVMPVLIIILLYSMYFTELVRAKLKLQEASRYAAWEMTSYTLDDYGNKNHNKAFALARDFEQQSLLDKYADLESIDTRTTGNFVIGYSNPKATITQHDAPAFTSPIPAVGGNFIVSGLLGVLNGSANAAYNHFGFNTRGKVEVEVSIQLDNRLLPRRFLDEQGGFFQADVFGGRNLQNVTIKNRFTLLASGWDLPDGADAEQHQTGSGSPRSGVHRGGSDQGLYTQVDRMSLLGAPDKLGSIPGFNGVMNLLQTVAPNPIDAVYVVSNNYFDSTQGGFKDRGCDNDPGHGAQSGMNNLQSDDDSGGASDGPGLDYQKRKCFDTAPFRDTSSYAGSHYRTIFMARGQHFMGCKKAQADDPAIAGPPAHIFKDKHNKKYNCEGP